MHCLYFTQSLVDQLDAYGKDIRCTNTSFEDVKKILTDDDLTYLNCITSVLTQYRSMKTAPLRPTNGLVEELVGDALKEALLEYNLPLNEEDFFKTHNCVVLRDNILAIFPGDPCLHKHPLKGFFEQIVKSMDDTSNTDNIFKSDVWQYLSKLYS